ncbi:neural cell adhesion molecule 1-like [Diadema antillarum]|uniref:neural cell adhesion molecule 1-like n=1 Tax=Diadema antillarum TaxID=105358 RepID=UPI003A892E8A
MMSLRFLSLLTLVLGCTTLPPAAGFEDIRALYGDRVPLVCPRICLPRRNPAGIRWTFRSKPAPSGNSTDVCIPTNDDKLIIEGVTLADEGDYHCHGVDDRPSYYSSCTFQLTVQVPVLKAIMSADDGPFLKDGETILIQEDDSKSFQCYSFGAKPAATITWFLSDTPVRREVPTFSYPSHSSPGRYDTSSELKLSRVTIPEFSNKSLKCMATGAGSSTVSVTITIQVYVPLERPMIREKVNVTLSRSWRSILLTCSASNSFPPASLHWSVIEGNATVRKLFPNHRPTRDPNAFALTRKGRSLVDKDSYLCDVRATLNQADKYDVTSHLFLMVDGRDDGKGITCHASSSIAEISPLRSQATELHIKSPPINLRTNWSLEQVVEGARIAIECEAVGANPRPANFVYWVRGDNGRRAQRSNKLDGVGSTANGSSSVLVFSNVTRSDAGPYKCVADNGIGAVELSSRIYVDVIYKPSIVTKQAAYNLQHDRVNITCIAEGHPPPSIKWTNPNPLNQTEERIHGTTTIGRVSIALDRSLRQTGVSEVMCIAYNILGNDEVSIAIDTSE